MSTEGKSSDILQNDTIPIVDCDVLEAAKENIQPLASGRRVTALSAVLSTPHAQQKAQHNAIKLRHKSNIQIALESHDPDSDSLEAYCRFVDWTLEAYPQGQSAESGLLELLEEATRVLKDDREGRWRAELRYLKLWVLYASYVEKPVIVYKFLLANDIGTEHAILYEEYAAVLERDGRRTDADEAYILGIARQAQPLEKIKSKYCEFQKRMMASVPFPVSSVSTAVATPASAKRTVLRASVAPSSHGDVFTASSSAPRPNGRLQIFVDSSGAASHNTGDISTPYPDIGTRKMRIKENVPQLRKANGTTLQQAGKAKRTASGGSKIVVFKDLDGDVSPPPSDSMPLNTPISAIVPFKDDRSIIPCTPSLAFTPFKDEPTPPESLSTVPGSVMKLKAGTKAGKGALSSEAEALRKDPLKNYIVAAGIE